MQEKKRKSYNADHISEKSTDRPMLKDVPVVNGEQ